MRITTLALMGCLIASPALASSACYQPAELEAEQLLRLHSELMVITVTCKTNSEGVSLVPSYTGFTKNNIDALHNAEHVMINYYIDHGSRDGTAALDKLRTKLANEYGQEAATKSSMAFCEQKRERVDMFYKKSTDEVEGEAKRMMVAQHSYVHPCGSETVVAHKGK